jgi:hypothetical protein
MDDSFQVGEQVSIIDETGVFVIKEIHLQKMKIEDEFGFERIIELRSVVKRRAINSDRVQQKDQFINNQLKVNPKVSSLPEIDLHIESLIPIDSQMSAHEKFTLQINQFKRFTNQMIQRKVTRFRVIHGIGEGKLKSEIRSLLQNRAGFTMHDYQIANGKVGASIIEMQVTKVIPFT